jgi:hypothetical protein
MSLLQGGFPVYGIPIGIIMLDCSFPRPAGDIGNAMTFPYPVHYEVLEGIPSEDLTRVGKETAVNALIQAGKRLEAKGVRGILTSCGLLIRYQELLAQTLKIPVATSSLLLLPLLGVMIPRDQKIGVITADSRVLTPEVLAQAGWTQMDRISIKGIEGSETFRESIMEPSPPFKMDTVRLCEETVSVCRDFIQEEPRIGVLLLECTNLAPYRAELSKTLSIPVFDIIHLADLIYKGVAFQ